MMGLVMNDYWQKMFWKVFMIDYPSQVIQQRFAEFFLVIPIIISLLNEDKLTNVAIYMTVM